MTVFDAIAQRYSCRMFSAKPVERPLLAQLMEAATRAPSACNAQRWAFIAVDSPEQKMKIAATMEHPRWKINRFASQVPAFLAVISHPVRTPTSMQQDLLGEDGANWQDFDLGMATQNICLAATGLGLGTVVTGWFNQSAVQEALQLPETYQVRALVCVGYPERSDHIRTTPRLAQEQTIFFDTYSAEE